MGAQIAPVTDAAEGSVGVEVQWQPLPSRLVLQTPEDQVPLRGGEILCLHTGDIGRISKAIGDRALFHLSQVQGKPERTRDLFAKVAGQYVPGVCIDHAPKLDPWRGDSARFQPKGLAGVEVTWRCVKQVAGSFGGSDNAQVSRRGQLDQGSSRVHLPERGRCRSRTDRQQHGRDVRAARNQMVGRLNVGLHERGDAPVDDQGCRFRKCSRECREVTESVDRIRYFEEQVPLVNQQQQRQRNASDLLIPGVGCSQHPKAAVPQHERHLLPEVAKRIDQLLRSPQEGFNGFGRSGLIARDSLELAVNRGQPRRDIAVSRGRRRRARGRA